MNAELTVGLIALSIAGGISWVVYTVLLWIVLRTQGLNYTILGKLVSLKLE